LRETLAAALALTARPREDTLFWDPTCGSGTIAIEAAMILQNRAPGLGRTFIGEAFPQIPADAWKTARESAEAAIRRDAEFEVWASDIDEDVLDVAYENALRAGVEEHLRIFQADVRTIEKPDRRGTIVCNPPYGERLMTPEEAEALYRDMGRVFDGFLPWQIYIITSHPAFEKCYGRRADKIRKLYNGMIPCNLYQYFKPQN
jgi:putative N6-adenine-specific DNA methylase